MNIAETLKNNRFLENIHIFFWLIKDSCWMMEWKFPGMLMIFPTVLIAVWMIYRTRHDMERWVNISVLLWILANSWWMITEFFGVDEKLKFYSALPFCMGFMFFFIYVWQFKTRTSKYL